MLVIGVQMDERVIQQLKRIGDGLMALKDELEALRVALDNATNQVATRIDNLKQQVMDLLNNPNTITAQDKATVEAGFQAEIDRLTTLGADASNPVPPSPANA